MSTDEKKLKELISGELRKAHVAGMAQGAKAMCGVVLKKAQDALKTPEEKLLEIITFCSKALSPESAQTNIGKDGSLPLEK